MPNVELTADELDLIIYALAFAPLPTQTDAGESNDPYTEDDEDAFMALHDRLAMEQVEPNPNQQRLTE